MKFQFNINIDDKDYLDYNIFWITKSPYGKKQTQYMRFIIVAAFALCFLFCLYKLNFTPSSFLTAIPLGIVAAVFLLLIPLYNKVFLKFYLKSLKKKGKMAYSASSVIELYEDSFVEITPDNKTEQKYSSIERISVIENKVVYIHVNNLAAYMIPFSCFETQEKYEDFLAFIKTKCVNIDRY